jgi:hypothetical protein
MTEPEPTLTDEDIKTAWVAGGESPKALENNVDDTDADDADDTDAGDADDDATDEGGDTDTTDQGAPA